MTAGSGILHQEMPQGDPQGRMHGFQLWANLPASLKMTAPRYQDIGAGAIPEVTDDDGTRVRVICGSFRGKTGPVEGVAADPRYLDVWMPPGRLRPLPFESSRHAFASVFECGGRSRDASAPRGVQTEWVAGSRGGRRLAQPNATRAGPVPSRRATGSRSSRPATWGWAACPSRSRARCSTRARARPRRRDLRAGGSSAPPPSTVCHATRAGGG